MKKLIIKILFICMVSNYCQLTKEAKAFTPYYYLPTKKYLKKEGLSIGKYAYQLLYLGQVKDSLNLAKLAVKINKSDVKLWIILSEAQIANDLYEDALISLEKGQKLDSKISQIYFTKSSIFLKQSKIKKAKLFLEEGLKLEPENQNALFYLGNIFLMEKNYASAIKFFNKSIKIKPDFWQAHNNIGLAYFEENKTDLSIKFFKKAISIEENAEPLLGLASCLRIADIDSAVKLAKKALKKDHKYVNYEYRKEQLWGEKIQKSTEELFKNTELLIAIKQAKSKIN